MHGHAVNAKGYEYCSGCGVCLLVCPLWRSTGAMSYTRKARARALQGGAALEDIAASVDACLLCGSCEPVCPEGIGISGMNMEQRQRLNQVRTDYPAWYPGQSSLKTEVGARAAYNPVIFISGEYQGSGCNAFSAIIGLLGGDKKASLAHDSGSDIAAMLEAGLAINPDRIDDFIMPLRRANKLVVAEGLLHRPLRKWLPHIRVAGTGEALLSLSHIRKALGPKDLYVIEPRGYHSAYKSMVRFYDRLRKETGCQMNLDLQRVAIPTGASSLRAKMDIEAAGCLEQAGWILKGRDVERIVVEDPSDLEVFRHVTALPVVHVCQLGEMH